jgi:hypothetical protein
MKKFVIPILSTFSISLNSFSEMIFVDRKLSDCERMRNEKVIGSIPIFSTENQIVANVKFATIFYFHTIQIKIQP